MDTIRLEADTSPSDCAVGFFYLAFALLYVPLPQSVNGVSDGNKLGLSWNH